MVQMEKRGASLVLLVLVAFLATSLALESHIRVTGDGHAGEPCCDECFCTKSRPPHCHCADVKTYCHVSCGTCACTKSIPPMCHCLDMSLYCDKPCKPAIYQP